MVVQIDFTKKLKFQMLTQVDLTCICVQAVSACVGGGQGIAGVYELLN